MVIEPDEEWNRGVTAVNNCENMTQQEGETKSLACRQVAIRVGP